MVSKIKMALLVFTITFVLSSDTNMNIRENLNFQKPYLELLKCFNVQYTQLPAKRRAKSVKFIARKSQLREFVQTFSILISY